MDSSENQSFRASALGRSRLPLPGSTAAGLQELTDSQHNARAQASLMAPPMQKSLKRELPQPASQPESKRKPLSERALEYPAKPSLAASMSAPRSVVKGSSLTSVAKQHSRNASTASTTSRNTSNITFASSYGPGSRQGPERPKTSMSNRPLNGRAKNPMISRPQTAFGHREDEDEYEGTHGQQNAWDVDERLQEVESQFKEFQQMMNSTVNDRKVMEDAIELAKTKVSGLETERNRLDDKNAALQMELDGAREQIQRLTLELETERRTHKYEVEDKSREHRYELDQLRRELNEETERLQRSHREALEALERHYRVELEDERSLKTKEVEEMRAKMGTEQQDMHLVLQRKDHEIQDMRAQAEDVKGDLDREQTLRSNLQKNIAELSAANVTLEAKMNSLRSHIGFLESDSKAQSDSFASMEARLQDALRSAEESRQKLIKEETERRVLFNKYQELKGNIRVMCRVRPVLDELEGEQAQITFPDEKTSTEISLQGPEEKSSLGSVSRKQFPFEFDRVFAPGAQNEGVFDEISQLVQSALDGYNVCIFCYGQTGSGKTYTMSSADGMIPRATHMIYDTITKLKEKSWQYSMEGCFIEVYNEELHDLLSPNGRDSDGKPKKLEIRHDEVRRQTTVSNCKSVRLDSADKVESMLALAQSNRSVAATKANERSSRSHSIFILKLVGENTATGERCEGTLNLVDLAGSERLKQSGAEGERMRETQNINKSLACLGDVIEALGRGSGHIPYRNSKLTHLLQYSLGGNSKTLMFVMVSPLEVHLKETLTSLRFATKVHNTHIGTAKAMKKTKDRNES